MGFDKNARVPIPRGFLERAGHHRARAAAQLGELVQRPGAQAQLFASLQRPLNLSWRHGERSVYVSRHGYGYTSTIGIQSSEIYSVTKPSEKLPRIDRFAEAAARAQVPTEVFRLWALRYLRGVSRQQWSHWETGLKAIPPRYIIDFLLYRIEEMQRLDFEESGTPNSGLPGPAPKRRLGSGERPSS